MASDTEGLLKKTLRLVAPGTTLYEGIEHILNARTGALIVVGDTPEVLALCDGGFRMDAELTPAALYELAKMDGAIVLSTDLRRIVCVNAHLTPDPGIPTTETGTRHRTAERVARQTGQLVIAISQRRNVVTLYRGNLRYVVRDINVLLAKANQALSALERYKGVLDQAVTNLTALEFEDLATLYDVSSVLQRAQMVARIAREIDRYVTELGAEGRLVNMELEELLGDTAGEGLLVIRDYGNAAGAKEPDPQEIWEELNRRSAEELLDLNLTARLLGYGSAGATLDTSVTPRGYRILSKIPRLPMAVVENLVARFGNLQRVLDASIEELDAVEGIGEARAKAVKDGLRRLREQVLLDRQL